MKANRKRGAIHRLAQVETGASLIEYSVLIGVITAAVLTIIISVAGWMSGRWQTIEAALGLSGG